MDAGTDDVSHDGANYQSDDVSKCSALDGADHGADDQSDGAAHDGR